MAGGGGPRLVYGDGLEDLKDCFTFGGRIGGGGGGRGGGGRTTSHSRHEQFVQTISTSIFNAFLA